MASVEQGKFSLLKGRQEISVQTDKHKINLKECFPFTKSLIWV